MVKKRNGNKEPREAALTPPHPRRKVDRMDLIEIRPGLFLNADQIVSVRVLPQEDEGVYAILQLSSGEKQNLSRREFTAITGEEPRAAMRPPMRRTAK